jgi:hypothetical protein
VNEVMNLQLPKIAARFLIGCTTDSPSSSAQLHRVNGHIQRCSVVVKALAIDRKVAGSIPDEVIFKFT